MIYFSNRVIYFVVWKLATNAKYLHKLANHGSENCKEIQNFSLISLKYVSRPKQHMGYGVWISEKSGLSDIQIV